MRPFDQVVIVDWSGGADRGPTPRKDAIWSCVAGPDGVEPPVYHRNRQVAEAWLTDRIAAELDAGYRVLAGFDFPFGYPQGFAAVVAGAADPLLLWDWLAERLEDAPQSNNRFDLAGRINALFPSVGPFWGSGLAREIPDLPRMGRARDMQAVGLAERRCADAAMRGAFTCWQLAGVGAVGSQALTGLPVLSRLRKRFSGAVSVWPFTRACDAPLVLAEVFPSLLADEVRAELARDPAAVRDAVQVRLLAGTLMAAQASGGLDRMFAAAPETAQVAEEAWVLGLGAEAELRQAARAAVHPGLTPPRLRNDCFALPQGVDWTPVDTALARLSDRLHPVVAAERVAVPAAAGRVLAQDAVAARSNPPGANSAVDGYGFAAAATGADRQALPLVEGRAAAGMPYRGSVPGGAAIRILTGALLPDGVDTVVLEEDTARDGGYVAFDGPVSGGANTRKAGEDVAAGAVALRAGRSLAAQDLALATALGLTELSVFKRLRVGVLSTGDEIAPPGPAGPEVTFDANRPMLLALAERWGHRGVDLGHVGDDRAALKNRMDSAACEADVILTSGGASAGEEDHVSGLLSENNALETWRVAVKPGRPLALGIWGGVPVFGLPGNPVAAFVCALIFARPSMALMAGADWPAPQGFRIPAAFAKNKKPGRREYLRARMDEEGRAEVFRSEGSGRISGLSWAGGLVELPDGAARITPGDPVTYYPFGSFGL